MPFHGQGRGLDMIIVVKCPGCKKPYELDGALAGKKSRCRQCGEIFRIPVPTARIVEPSQPEASRAASGSAPSWIATPVVDAPAAAPATARSARPAALEPAPLPRTSPQPPASTAYRAPAPTARPAPSGFDDDLPPPPRAGYRPKPQRRTGPAHRGGDTDAGINALLCFLALDVVLTLGMYLYIVLVETDAKRASAIYGLGTGVTFIIAGILALWGGIWLLSIAFSEDAIKGLLCMLVPGYALFYVASRWDERRGTLFLSSSPVLALVINLALAWLVAASIRERTPPPGIGPGSEAPNVASDPAAPDPTVPNPVPDGPVPSAPAGVSTSGRKADAAQVRRAEQLIRKGLVVMQSLNRTLATIHNEVSLRQAAQSLQFSTMFSRVKLHKPRNLDLGPNEVVALKHRVGGEIQSTFTDFKNQLLRIKSIPGVGDGLDISNLSKFDEIVALWSLQPGEEQVPELVEPPAPAPRFGQRGFTPGGPGDMRPGGNPFPSSGPRNFPTGPSGPPSDFGRVPMSSNIVEQADRDLQSMRQACGDRAASLIVNGLPVGGNAPPLHVTQAIAKRIQELAPEVASMRGATIGDRYEQAFGPVNDVQALALKIDFGAVKIKGARIEVNLDPKWAAGVPRDSAAARTATAGGLNKADDPEVPANADGVTRSLIELKSSDPWKRRRAMDRLQRTNADGRVNQVVAALVPQLEGDDAGLASEAAKALGVWRSPEAMTALIGRMGENRHFVRSDSIKALGKYKDVKAAQAIASVIKQDIFATEEALKAMGPTAEPAVIPQLRNPDSQVRSRACRVLAEIGGQATLVEMQSLPSDPDFGVRVAAQDAWKQIVARVGPPPRNARGKAGTASGKPGGAGR